MGQRIRYDEPGAWHHVMNRGIAKRSIAETAHDVKNFFFHLTRAVRGGWFEVHGYTLLSTHFHLLLRSSKGEMWQGMRLFQNGYVRWFNRARKRDGPLMRGRFLSKRIRSNSHWRSVVRYIDQNAPSARIAFNSGSYPYCSASNYFQTSGPDWLTRCEVEAVVCRDSNKSTYDPKEYAASFGAPLREKDAQLVERGLRSCIESPDALDDLVGGSSQEVRNWLTRKALLADGTGPSYPIAAAQTIAQAVRARATGAAPWLLGQGKKKHDGWTLMLVGLLRNASGQTFKEIAQWCECSILTAQTRAQAHMMHLRTDSKYAEMVAKVLSESLKTDWGPLYRDR